MNAPFSVNGVALQLTGVGKQFDRKVVLHELDLTLRAGEFVALVGRSGCGKSTLLRLVAGLDQASAGLIEADGKPHITARNETRLMFQDARLLPWKTVLQNVGLGLSGDWHEHAAAALAEVGLAEHAHKWPAQLSGGQRQRVALARALIHRPRLLLLDEPLGALDALTRIEMHQLIERLWQHHGFTVLLVTHDVQEAVSLADRVILIEEGRIGLDQAVDLPRPRARGTAAFAALEERILNRVLALPDTGTPPDTPKEPIVPAALRWAL
ncbi:ATP-binding cassette domain-containing protein [Silvimonas iriomotensis]|uniref:Aliphatic sulfonates import ATP-binding protein SsuB 3 n=1 Tax=Silvimonas iriomotensis TaxID=449662 RepID=A0ABQ2PC46_9NEIS|nr:ATP-binding cassette domain-containing protein [Silvimonas iriomotensis]GGP23075.1 aliphatic sulfonates import ATP-binding protein SsuB 3 [Silvimonas iriomotensis]